MPAIYHTTIETPIGFLKLKSDNEALLSVQFVTEFDNTDNYIPEILKDTIKQLEEYFNGVRKNFVLNLKPEGTLFQQKIWEIVKSVPFGKTSSYLQIARLSGTEKNTRAVGLANGKNPILIIIPCHRIIGNSGKLSGYAGGLERKQWLLNHEMQQEKPAGLLF